jgi:hypothetical protein
VQGAQWLAGRERRVGGVGCCEYLLGTNLNDGVDLVVYLLDALQVRRDDLTRRDLAGTNELSQRRSGVPPQFICHSRPPASSG